MTTYTATQVRKLRSLVIRAGYAKDFARDRFEATGLRYYLSRHTALAKRHERLRSLLLNVA